ncbi:AAA family ATPase [Pectobacterium carotovorum]|uniref:nucleotide-binding protein n=1 Tax=Pectobacterium carotovorum TaxID=554 RepID=UPI000500CD3C|nr:division plane positioning ATPase MipZ [Pectobacterium carotovorum]KFW97574.1 peptidyl-arginine deiminase [Pectobacterium carotovorum subsp. carotovorum]KML64955.1 peptidyl-arginine deiminase [Pectobacterium carotovorum subsp. carotovorum ICMP 5702]SHH68548.1 plasmid segregation oscillating ATPase ParF [Pectobacterium carotovorum]
MGRIAVFGSDKGGVGKSTTVANLAVMLAYKGISVIILKTDKNPDMLSWAKKREILGLPPIPVYEAYGDVSQQIKKLAKLCGVLLVDCAGHDSVEFRSALLVSDVLLTLVKPTSMFEKETLTTVTETVRKAQASGNPDLEPFVLITRVKPNKLSDAVELTKELTSDSVWIQPLKTRLSELDIFETACNNGAGVHDMARASSLSKAKAQIELLAQEIGLVA